MLEMISLIKVWLFFPLHSSISERARATKLKGIGWPVLWGESWIGSKSGDDGFFNWAKSLIGEFEIFCYCRYTNVSVVLISICGIGGYLLSSKAYSKSVLRFSLLPALEGVTSYSTVFDGVVSSSWRFLEFTGSTVVFLNMLTSVACWGLGSIGWVYFEFVPPKLSFDCFINFNF